MYKIAKENLSALFQSIAENQELYLPVEVSGQVNFKAWTPDAKVSLETLKTVKSPKDAFFPQSENLYTVQKEGKKLSIEPQALREQNFVVFGMKACDIQGVKVLDNVFLSDPVDSFYAARREHGTIVAMACHEPEESCFCKVFGIDCAEPAADVATWMVEGELYWKALTDKGEALTKAVESLLTEADGTDAESWKQKNCHPYHRRKTSILRSVPGRMERRRTDRKIQFSCMGRTVQTMSGMWYLYLRMPDLPVLRYQRL